MIRISMFAVALLTVACGALPFFGSKSTSNHTSSESSRQTESVKVNGEEVGVGDDEPETRAEAKTSDIGKTCHKNQECQADACFVGSGDLGYCTKMCNSWSDCPTHWECKKPGNAPQKICMQGN